MNKNIYLSGILLALCIPLSSAFAQEGDLPVQSQTVIPSVAEPPLPAGMTSAIATDWRAGMRPLSPAPDHSLRTIWVRMFPLLAVPGGDPYPETHDAHHLYLHNDSGMDIFNANNQKLLGSTDDLTLDLSKSSFLIGKTKESLQPLWIVPKAADFMQMIWDKGNRSHEVGVRVHGGVVIEQTHFDSDGKTLWSAVNVLDLEMYLQSVVASEAIITWLPTALQVQAVAARTYALHQVSHARLGNQNWDLDPTTQYQSYRGAQYYVRGGATWAPIEQPVTIAAVGATAGQAVVYHGEIIEAYFSANSGGVTCTASECFQEADLPYLQSVPDAPGIQAVAGGTWGTKANLTTKSIHNALVKMGIKPKSTVRSVEALKIGPSGRVWQLRVQLSSGQIDLSMEQTRTLMELFGSMRSFLYVLRGVDHSKQTVVGHGYGHGVGMSQWGAQLYAQLGWPTAQILEHYYTGTQIQNLTEAPVP